MKPELVFCTAFTKNYLADVRTLAASVRKHHSDAVFYALLIDKPDDYFDPKKELFSVIMLEDLPEQETVEKMCFYYNAKELSCAIRPMLHEYILKNTRHTQWMFLDSDIFIVNSLENIALELMSDEVNIFLTPHFLRPIAADDPVDGEFENRILSWGAFNAGFLGLKRSLETEKFIQWWKSRLIYQGFLDHPKGQCYDQFYFNVVPVFFDGVKYLRIEGANVSYWNLHERKLTQDAAGKLYINGSPLLFFHFSGWQIENPERVSKHAQVSCSSPQAWKSLSDMYRKELMKNGYEKNRAFPYRFNFFKNGASIELGMRRVFYERIVSGQWGKTSPFDEHEFFIRKKAADDLCGKKSFLTRVKKKLKSFF